MKKLKQFIKLKLDLFAIKRFMKLMPKQLITQMYKSIAQSDIEIASKVVNVKKGGLKYTVVYLETKNLEGKFVISRHGELLNPTA